MVAGKAVEKFAMEIEEQQQLLMNAADMIIQVYAAESAILRAEKLAGIKGEEAVSAEIDMARLYLHFAVEHIGVAGREGIYSFTEGDEQRALLMGLKRYTKVNNPINVRDTRKRIAARVIEENKYPFAY